MTETGILNRDIAAELARMGHTDRLLIACLLYTSDAADE